MAIKDCPDRRQLAAYARGERSAKDAQSIGLHVAFCVDCQAALQSLGASRWRYRLQSRRARIHNGPRVMWKRR